SDAQVDTLIRMTVAIAEAGNDTADRRAANDALAHGGHAGARHALVDALRNARTTKNAELRPNLYRGLARIEHPDVVAFLVDRLFVEREAYGALVDALAARHDTATHRRVLAALAARATDLDATRAATLYADLLVETDQPPKLIVELARAMLAWQP